jgi:hypothetical protein
MTDTVKAIRAALTADGKYYRTYGDRYTTVPRDEIDDPTDYAAIEHIAEDSDTVLFAEFSDEKDMYDSMSFCGMYTGQ